MNVDQHLWPEGDHWEPVEARGTGEKPQLVLVFGSTERLSNPETLSRIRQAYPEAILAGCSTAGEIHGTGVHSGAISVTALSFRHSAVKAVGAQIAHIEDSFAVGSQLGQQLLADDLVHIVVFSDGLKVNGTELVKGLTGALPEGVTVTGGLSGDGDRFAKTLVVHGETARENQITAVGFYGNRLRVGYGSMGGWDPFGPERMITRSSGNVLYEVNGKSALALYKTYLGEHAEGLPGTGLLFPLSIRRKNEENWLVRTILAADEETQSLTFAGDVPEGARARLMRANFDRLVDGAYSAAEISNVEQQKSDFALLISCVGRRMVLNWRVEDEIEAVREVFGSDTALAGFYSYGEISPFERNAVCELHNQTMTITTFNEI
ncbi:MAG TPA: FIST N-terminal domain-containing protein [Calditrichia bacterium]|nr:FIST N-terminal domain-containing protein [Calditrichia bacterium]